ncbi:MAG TPA: ATP-binding cassette domain-containing protein [Candidatus Saccharimonadales bacterium]|nr:ATP-binding cassette domain-containing protein [Candidatus Saccharimonadales bacterium]
MIKASNLTKRYRKKLAVDDISFEVQTGKVTGFLGPNGAGKSTTMRLMLGLDNGKGQTTFDGKPLHQHNHPSEIVGILLEAKAFHPTRSARNHLKILATAGNIPAKRVDEVLDIVGLKSEAKKKPGKFSLGMSQRLGIAAALLGNPKYLLLDEPANGLDPEGIVWLRDFLKNYADEGNAVFVSSHLLSEMSQMADDVVVIGKGKLIADTSIKELISSNTSSSVFVRSSGLAKLEKLLKDKKITFKKADGGLRVSDKQTDEIGKLAFAAGVPILELASHDASLEDVFLELTAGTEEYKAHDGGKK